MVKAMQKKRSKDVPNAEMFIKRPWTDEEENQLRESVRTHGPNNWGVICRDRKFIEMIGNHTMEDIKTRWRMIEKGRKHRRDKAPPTMAGATHAGPPDPSATGKLGVMNQLKLKQTLVTETEKRRELAEEIEAERKARLEAEKQAALQMRERKKLAQKLAEFESLVKTGGSLPPVAPVRPPRHPMGATGGAGAGDDAMSRVSRARSARSEARSYVSEGSSYVSGSTYTGRPESEYTSRSRGTARSMVSRLSSSSAAIAASQRTRERARELLDRKKGE